nr:DUF1672 family protein [Sutcliffiella horikoshii]
MVVSIVSLLIISGCSYSQALDAPPNTLSSTEKRQSSERFIRVQDYTGEGYTLRNGDNTDKIALDNKEEIEDAVEKFFLEKYKTKVIVHNIVGAVDGATVFVESVGEPHFYTYAIVPIDVDHKKVLSDIVWSQDGQVEDAIITGIFGMIFDQEIDNYEAFIHEIVEQHPVVGITDEALKNVRAGGFGNSYYYVNSRDPVFKPLLQKYLEEPDKTEEEWKSLFTENDYPSKGIIFTLYLFMEQPDTDPDETIFNDIVQKLENLENIPKGYYSVILNDNLIDSTNALGFKENSLMRAKPDHIVKE